MALSDSLIEANKGNVSALYDSWIEPSNNFDKGRQIAYESEAAGDEIWKDIVAGFERFCDASGGVVTHPEVLALYSNECTARDGSFIGEFHLIRWAGQPTSKIQVGRQNPAGRLEREAKQKIFETRKELNGPTGWVTTNKGRFPFLRIGTLTGRDVIDIEVSNNKYVPIEEVSKVDFHKPCCDMTVYQKDGQTATLNQVYFRHRYALNSAGNYGIDGLPFVMIDIARGELYEQRFSNFDGIETIKIDPESDWKGKSGTEVKHLAVYHASAKVNTSEGLIKFIKTYQDNDPERLVAKARKQLPIIEAQEAKLAALKRKEIVRKDAEFRGTVTAFRRTVRVGNDSHCGLVIELKRPLVKVQTIAGERWFKISQIYPAGMASCNFFNNTYQEPIGLPL